MEQDQCTNLLQAIAALQAQMGSIQTNMAFLLEALKEIKEENGNRRDAIDAFASATRERLAKVENDLGLIRWITGACIISLIAIAVPKVVGAISQVETKVEHQK